MDKREVLLKIKDFLSKISISILVVIGIAYLGQYLGFLEIFETKLIVKIAISLSFLSGFIYLMEHRFCIKSIAESVKFNDLFKKIPYTSIFLYFYF